MSKSTRGKLAQALSRALGLYRSRAFILGTILALTVIYFLGVVVPQRSRLGPAAFEAWRETQPILVGVLEALGVTDAFRSPLTIFVTVLFFISLLSVIAQRLPALFRHTRLDQGVSLNPRSLARRPGVRVLPQEDPPAAVIRIGARLEALGYRIHAPAAGAVRGVRFRYAPLGFLIFHASFGFLLVGGILLDQTRFSVTVPVAVGESFSTREGPFTEVPRLPRAGLEAIPDLAFRVLSIRPEADEGHPTGLVAEVLLAGESQPSKLEVNYPLERGSTSLLIMNVGPTALFVCETAKGEEDGAYVKLDPAARREGRFRLEACGLEMLARPAAPEDADLHRTGAGVMVGTANTGSVQAALPSGIEFAARRSADETPLRGVLKVGESVAPDDAAWRLRLEEIRYYGEFQIIDESGGAFLVAGFLLGLLGLCGRLLFYRREVVASAGEGEVYLFATADGVGMDRRESLLDALVE